MLYIVKFPDGGTYAAPAQGELASGPIAFEDAKMAREMAAVIDGGYVEPRLEDQIIARCKETGAVLYIRRADGKTAYIPDTITSLHNHLRVVPVSETEGRDQLIKVANRHLAENGETR